MHEDCKDHGEIIWCWPGGWTLSDFETEAESEENTYNESDSDDSNSSKVDGSIHDNNATANSSDSSSSFGSDLEASGDDEDESSSTSVRGRVKWEGEAGIRKDQEWEEGEGAEVTQQDTEPQADEGGQVQNPAAVTSTWTTVGEATKKVTTESMDMGKYSSWGYDAHIHCTHCIYIHTWVKRTASERKIYVMFIMLPRKKINGSLQGMRAHAVLGPLTVGQRDGFLQNVSWHYESKKHCQQYQQDGSS